MEKRNDKLFRFICLGLVLGTLIAYGSVIRNDFITYDDGDYITENPHAQTGLTWRNVVWAFTTGHAGNWHPIAWLSHMLDCQVYGLHPGGHHLTNLLFHLANTLLLFQVLCRMTGATWRSAVVAALFAWHPLHVQSVAWVSERKDMLSTFFGLLTMMAYIRYVEESKAQTQSPRSKVFYRMALLMFALGLMSKPMLVTLPFVLLLLDYWPLRRISDLPGSQGRPGESMTWGRLTFEKAPFFVLAAASSVVTFFVQKAAGAMPTSEFISRPHCIANALLSYVRYLGK